LGGRAIILGQREHALSHLPRKLHRSNEYLMFIGQNIV
jgi:hypothetical protein